MRVSEEKGHHSLRAVLHQLARVIACELRTQPPGLIGLPGDQARSARSWPWPGACSSSSLLCFKTRNPPTTWELTFWQSELSGASNARQLHAESDPVSRCHSPAHRRGRSCLLFPGARETLQDHGLTKRGDEPGLAGRQTGVELR